MNSELTTIQIIALSAIILAAVIPNVFLLAMAITRYQSKKHLARLKEETKASYRVGGYMEKS